MTATSLLIRLCVAPVAAWAAFRLFDAFYRHVGEPMWRRTLLGPRPYQSLDPRADRFIEGNRETARALCYIAAFCAAVSVFVV